MQCPACQTEIGPGMTFCPTCRARGSAPFAKGIAPPPAPAASDPNERTFLIIACLLSVGVFAVPRLLRSKAYGPVGKTVLGIAAALNTTAAVTLLVLCIVKGPALIMSYVRNR